MSVYPMMYIIAVSSNFVDAVLLLDWLSLPWSFAVQMILNPVIYFYTETRLRKTFAEFFQKRSQLEPFIKHTAAKVLVPKVCKQMDGDLNGSYRDNATEDAPKNSVLQVKPIAIDIGSPVPTVLINAPGPAFCMAKRQ
jgi:hypothetical protein